MNKNEFLTLLSQFEQKEVYFGPQGFQVMTNEQELSEAQVGFSIAADGSYLTGEAPGMWQASWIVCALDTELGDPYFIDVNEDSPSVYSAVYIGDEQVSRWETTLVAESLDSFAQCLALLYGQGQQQAAKFVPDDNTLSEPNALAQLEQKLAECSSSKAFWAEFFACYHDWLSDDD